MKKQKGSLLIGVLIMMLIVSATAIALINRSFQGTVLTIDSKKGYIAYQTSDSNAEKILNDVRKFDTATNTGQIPENTPASTFCTDEKGANPCFGLGGNVFVGDGNNKLSEKKVSDIYEIKAVTEDQGLKKAIQMGIGGRISLGNDKLEVKKCGDGADGCTWNSCDAKVSFTPSSDSKITDKIKDYEVRRSLENNDLTSGEWWAIGSNPNDKNDAKLHLLNDPKNEKNFILKNGDAHMDYGSGDSQYDKTYYFTIKARNKNPLMLDSLYLADADKKVKASVELEKDAVCEDDNTDSFGVLEERGCTADDVAGTEELTGKKSNCCNGTRCLKALADWKADDDKKCALQQCNASDNVGIKPAGTSKTGYCGTKEDCKPGESCAKPYKTLGYCLSAPAPSTQSSFFGNTGWDISGEADVYEDPLFSETKNRCSKHLCPSIAEQRDSSKCGTIPYAANSWRNTSTCTERECGPYEFINNCDLNCNAGYFSAQPTANHSGSCCYEYCPAGPPYNGAGACSYALPDINASKWTNLSRCESNRCATASNRGYTVTESCKMECKSGFHFSGSSQNNPVSGCCLPGSIPNQCGSLPSVSNGYWVDYSSAFCSGNSYAIQQDCRKTCNYGYHLEGGSCVYNYRYNVACPALPTGAHWNGSSTYMQTWYGYWWPSFASAQYGYGTCGISCDANYSWNGSTCVPATRTFYCNPKPANADWNNVNSYLQTWNGSGWSPVSDWDTNHSAVGNPSWTSCRFKCAPGYSWNGSSCAVTVYHCGRCSTWQYNQYVNFDSYSPSCTGPFNTVYRFDASCQCGAPYHPVGNTCVL